MPGDSDHDKANIRIANALWKGILFFTGIIIGVGICMLGAI